MNEVQRIFQREINKMAYRKEIYRDTVRRQLNRASGWELEIWEQEIKREYGLRGYKDETEPANN